VSVDVAPPAPPVLVLVVETMPVVVLVAVVVPVIELVLGLPVVPAVTVLLVDDPLLPSEGSPQATAVSPMMAIEKLCSEPETKPRERMAQTLDPKVRPRTSIAVACARPR